MKKYRADIDGLRAIAILFVLAFHAGLTIFPSGFIGVDIFFVISGYLITGILCQSIENKAFSFTEFYSRRLWRLQPVFICLLVCTAVFTMLVYLPDDLLHYTKSARKTSLFLSNQFFGRETTGYFSPQNTMLPLLHTWSLSIEWQCYLVLPLLLYLLHQWLSRRSIKWVIYALTTLFFVLTIGYSSLNPANHYYRLLSRLFEFFIGASVVFTPIRIPVNKILNESLSLAALFILAYLATRKGIQVGFPNWYALWVSLGTGVLIALGNNQQPSLVTRIVSLKPMVFIGLISYSLYIWHWPVFVLIRYLAIEESKVLLIFAFASIGLIAYLSWRFIEKPARQFHQLSWPYTIVILLLAPLLVFHLADSTAKKNQGYPQRFKEAAYVFAKQSQYENPIRPLCLDDKNTKVNKNCLLGSTKAGAKSALFFGDSYSNHYWRFVDTFAKEANVSVVAHATIACLALPDISLYDWKDELYTACQQQTRRYYAMIQKNHYDMVLLAQNWNGYLSKKLSMYGSREAMQARMEQSLDKALAIITQAGSKPFLIKSIASGDAYNCFFQHMKLRQAYNPERCAFRLQPQDTQWQDELFARMEKKYPELVLIDPKQSQCAQGTCKADIKGMPLFRDPSHISDYGAYQLAKQYLQMRGNPLA